MKCRRCPGETTTGLHCSDCRKRIAKHFKDQRADKKARGECYNCTLPAKVGSVFCVDHAERRASAAKNRRSLEALDYDEPPAPNVPRCWCGLLDDGHGHETLRATYYAENRRGEQFTRDSL